MEETCFIIAPIGSETSAERDRIESLLKCVFEPVVHGKYFYKIIISHKLHNPGIITNQIYKRILDSELIIADLTGLNANVMYEYAIAQFLNKKIIVVATHDTSIPFDIYNIRTIFYKDGIGKDEEFRNKLDKTLEEIQSENEDNENPIYNAISVKEVIESIAGNKSVNKENTIEEKSINKLSKNQPITRNIPQNVQSINQPVTNLVKSIIKSDSTIFYNSVIESIKNKSFPFNTKQLIENLVFTINNKIFEIDLGFESDGIMFLAEIKSSTSRRILQRAADRLIALNNQSELNSFLRNKFSFDFVKIQPIIITTHDVIEKSGRRVLSKIHDVPILMFDSEKCLFTNGEKIKQLINGAN